MVKKIFLFLFFFISLFLSLFYGDGGFFSLSISSNIFFYIRLPRVILSFLVGAGLSICGAVYQLIFKNPLATPYTLGVSQGASFGAIVGILLSAGNFYFIFSGTVWFSFLGALFTVILIYFIVYLKKSFSPYVILLSGVAVSFFFSSLILFIEYMSDFTKGFQIIRWLMGSLSTAGYGDVIAILTIFFIVSVFLFLLGNHIFILLLGDELAVNRGVNPDRIRILIFLITSLLIGVIVSICGPIGFVGLMVPHIIYLLFGNNFRKNFFFLIFGGGGFLILCDFISRTLIFPAEIPVGVFTALLGGPFFLWVLFNFKEKI